MIAGRGRDRCATFAGYPGGIAAHNRVSTVSSMLVYTLGGMREDRGMPNFVHTLSIEQASAIHACLVKRAHDELAASAPK